MSDIYRRPCGDHTRSVRLYVREWRAIGRALEKLLDARVYGFDPGFALLPRLDDRHTISISMWAAVGILTANNIKVNAKLPLTSTPKSR
jgi:hypothetical protein